MIYANIPATPVGKTIREEFAESTILTIAHRLATIVCISV
jgi:ABC-type multidrug transport system fused ATPase/permease subunit